MKYLAPYQIFFPLGILSALLGGGLWLFQDMLPSIPVMLVHSKLMTGGFLWSFITGFLMTALPRMSGTEGAKKWEITVAVILILLQIGLSWVINPVWFYGNNALLVLFILFFGGYRLLKAGKTVPVFFSHVGLAMAAALMGCYFYGTGSSSKGLLLYFVAPILLLILGIGTRFFSFLSGLPSIFESSEKKGLKVLFHLMGFSVMICLYLAGMGLIWSYLILSLVTVAYLVFIWRIFRSSDRKSALKHAVRIVAIMIPLSFFLCWLQPALMVTWLHLLFIGCFSLLTFAVATRVTLAHGSYPLDLEMKTPTLWFFLAFVVLALIFRVSYGMTMGPARTMLLHFAVAFWLGGLVTWCSSFLVRILKPGNMKKPACG